MLHDITALKKVDRMKSEFVSMVSHEIRSPMNSVLMQIQVLLDGLAGELTEKQRDILTRAFKKIDNLAHMTTELLEPGADRVRPDHPGARTCVYG